ncbi:DUF4331 domain-containing protein [Prosthecobacter sp. SYSU 5D2]|uniref:DUF4331 domain-containing protein n=1 Tax=Prosthecobacter sp. SYSU 5D2 TaxID=3134134 RepID=UPI0031FE555E
MKPNTTTGIAGLRRWAGTAPGRMLAIGSALLTLATPQTWASSHSDAPLIKQDPQVNLTDVYTFVRQRPSGERVLVVEVSVRPFSEPGDGVIYDRFADDAEYNIHIANPVTGATLQQYTFRFSDHDAVKAPGLKNPNTILSYGLGTELGPILTVGDARQNYTQTYSVSRIMPDRTRPGRRHPGNRPGDITSLGKNLLVPPPNVGMRTTPPYNDPETGRAVSGATSRETLDTYTRETTYDLPGGVTVFAGPREDGFFADTPGIFDLLDSRILDNNGSLADGLGQDGAGVDGFKGFNVLHYGIVIPLSQLPSIAYTGALQPAATGVGVFATVGRPRVVLFPSRMSASSFVQVNRLGNPLFNEVLVALGSKDLYNRTLPTTDASTFARFAENPEVATLINTVFSTTFPTTGRGDLKAVYIPDVIRVNTTTGPVPVQGEEGFSRLSFIGGDVVEDGNGNMVPSGWPNGRRFGDDVVDIALTAVASGPTFETITVVGDNVPANDQVYNRTFPYAATPHAGTRHQKDSGVNAPIVIE